MRPHDGPPMCSRLGRPTTQVTNLSPSCRGACFAAGSTELRRVSAASFSAIEELTGAALLVNSDLGLILRHY